MARTPIPEKSEKIQKDYSKSPMQIKNKEILAQP